MSAREFKVERWALRYARIALGAAFLSGIADRFGLWGKNVGYGDFAHFVKYTAEVNSFMPAFTIPFLAWAATVAELVLGIALISGVWLRWVALGSALLLVLFGTAMAISFGLKSPKSPYPTFLPQRPKRSAMPDRNAAPSAIRA